MKRRGWAVALPAASIAAAIAVGCIALVLRGLATTPSGTDWMYVRPGAAVGLVLAGIALWVACKPRRGRLARWLQVGCAAALAVLGALTLAEYIVHADLGIDRILVFEALPHSPTGYDRMPIATAASFVLLGLAFVLLNAAPRARRSVDALALLIGLTAYVPLLAYAYGAAREYGISRATAIPLPTAAILTGVAISLLAVRPERGVFEIATSDSAGGRIARALLPTAIAAPAAVGLVVVWGRAAGLYDASYGTALEAFASVLVLSVVIFRTAHALHRTDVEWHRTAQRLAEETAELRSLKQELERRVAQRTAELSSANAELASFSYSVSHDLRAPLRWADGFSMALIEDYGDQLDAQARQYLQHIREAVQRMGQLIDDVLKLSRITRMDLEREPVDLGALAREIVAELRRTSPERDVELVVASDAKVTGDRRLLQLALDNLLRNAWKFTSPRERARIEFGTIGTDGKRAFFVRDNGVGFDPNYVGKLFRPFERLHRSDQFEGTGVGLATVRHIVQRHGGDVWAEGGVDAGATFYFTLPDAGAEDRPVAAEAR